MAAGTKLNMVFNNSAGGTTSYTWAYANPSATTSNVIALGQAMIANTSILASTLVSLKSAKTVTTSENIYDLDTVALTDATARKYIDTGEETDGNPEREGDTISLRLSVKEAKERGLI